VASSYLAPAGVAGRGHGHGGDGTSSSTHSYAPGYDSQPASGYASRSSSISLSSGLNGGPLGPLGPMAGGYRPNTLPSGLFEGFAANPRGGGGGYWMGAGGDGGSVASNGVDQSGGGAGNEVGRIPSAGTDLLALFTLSLVLTDWIGWLCG
jgi:hypothetical protein